MRGIPQETRKRILTAAIELFYAKGFRTVRVDTIAVADGVRKRTLYQHFEREKRKSKNKRIRGRTYFYPFPYSSKGMEKISASPFPLAQDHDDHKFLTYRNYGASGSWVS